MNPKDELRNWGRAMCDSWLENHLDITEGPAWKQYVSGKSFDDPDEPHEPIDELRAERTERTVINIGLTNTDAMTVLILRYCHPELSLRRIAKRMHTTKAGAKRMIEEAERIYALKR